MPSRGSKMTCTDRLADSSGSFPYGIGTDSTDHCSAHLRQSAIDDYRATQGPSPRVGRSFAALVMPTIRTIRSSWPRKDKMIIPTKIDPSSLPEFVQQVGGTRIASRILAVPGKQIEDWCKSASAPQLALKLMWLSTPAGIAAQDDSSHRLNACLRDQIQSLSEELARLRQERDAQVEAAISDQRKLQLEVTRLKALVSQPGLSTVLDRLASELSFIAEATRLR